MLRKIAFSIIFFALAGLLATAGQRTGAGDNGNAQGSAKTASNSKDKRVGNTKSRWFADPERGWIKLDERREAQKKRGSSQDRVDNSSGKATGILWEY